MKDERKNLNYGGDRKNFKENNRGELYRLPPGYLQNGYYSDGEKRKLKKEYIVDYPRKLADLFDKDGGKDTNKRSQIRKFYEYILRVETKMRLQGNDFSLIEADLSELMPYVSYAGQRRVVSKLFIDFIESNVKEIHDEKDLKAFTKHFEAIVAFTKKD